MPYNLLLITLARRLPVSGIRYRPFVALEACGAIRHADKGRCAPRLSSSMISGHQMAVAVPTGAVGGAARARRRFSVADARNPLNSPDVMGFNTAGRAGGHGVLGGVGGAVWSGTRERLSLTAAIIGAAGMSPRC